MNYNFKCLEQTAMEHAQSKELLEQQFCDYRVKESDLINRLTKDNKKQSRLKEKNKHMNM